MQRLSWIVAAVVLLNPHFSLGSTVLYQTDAQLVALSERVVHGRVLSARAQWSPDRSTIHTLIRLAVLEDFTGFSDPVIEIREEGGRVDDISLHVGGAAIYEVGSEIVVCLERTRAGYLRSVGRAFSKFDVVRDGGAQGRLDRHMRRLTVVGAGVESSAAKTVAEFRVIASIVKNTTPVRPAGADTLLPDDYEEPRFTFHSNFARRWHDADVGVPVPWRMSTNAPAPVLVGDGTSEIRTAVSAWNAAMGGITLTYDSAPTSFKGRGPFPFAGVISFEDPDNELNSIDVAIAYAWNWPARTKVVNGTPFAEIYSAAIVFNNTAQLGQLCQTPLNFTRVLMHEIGHGIGLGHTDVTGPDGYANVMYEDTGPTNCGYYPNTPIPPAVGPDDFYGALYIYPPRTRDGWRLYLHRYLNIANPTREDLSVEAHYSGTVIRTYVLQAKDTGLNVDVDSISSLDRHRIWAAIWVGRRRDNSLLNLNAVPWFTGCPSRVPPAKSVGASGGTERVNVSIGAGCLWAPAGPYAVVPALTADWLRILPEPALPISGAESCTNCFLGPGAFRYSVDPNTSANPRVAQLWAWTGNTNVVLVTQVGTLSTNDADGDSLPDAWEDRFGLRKTTNGGTDGTDGDPDGDGYTNLDEFLAGTHPRGFFTRYFAEGATSSFFSTVFALANPGTASAKVLLRFQKGDGTTADQSVDVAAMSRATVVAKSVTGLTEAAFSTVVESDVAMVADRTMQWGVGGFGSHAETSLASAALTWYFAEGATHSGFNLFYLIQNADPDRDAQVSVTYLLPAPAAPVIKTYTVPKNSRYNIWVNNEALSIAALKNTDVSAILKSAGDIPIIVERAMYLDRPGEAFSAGHEAAAVTAPALNWFLAEGATGPYFDLFVLVANPNAEDAAITASYLLPNGTRLTKTYTVPKNSRYNIWVDQEELPAGTGQHPLANTGVSTTITSTNGVPVIVERSMWWPGPTAATWGEAHDSVGSTETGTQWGLADGQVGVSGNTVTYILIANTSAFAGTAQVTLLYENGPPVTKTFPLPANSRTNVDVAFEFPNAAGQRFGAIVDSVGASPAQIVVERAMYSDANGRVWAAGTSSLAMKLR